MNIKEIRILYMGTPELSANVLERLLKDGYNIVGLIAQPDKPVGRKQLLLPVPTKVVASKYNIPVYQIEKIRKEYEFVKDIKPDLILTLAYGQIIPQGLLDIPLYGCLNLHGSLLPKYRGAAPIQYALINHDKETGMTLMEMIDKMDAGRMYAQEKVIIEESDNSTSLFKKMETAAYNLVIKYLNKYIEGSLTGVIQDESKVTYCPPIKKEQEKISLDDSVDYIHGLIRALSDNPGAYLLYNNEKLKIFESSIYSYDVKGQVGEILEANKNHLLLQCKDGILSIKSLQKQGKNRMDYINFVNGNQSILRSILK